MKITLNFVDVSIEGDYYQVHFGAKEDDGSTKITDDPYFLIQRQFEMPDGGEVRLSRAKITRNGFSKKIRQSK